MFDDSNATVMFCMNVKHGVLLIRYSFQSLHGRAHLVNNTALVCLLPGRLPTPGAGIWGKMNLHIGKCTCISAGVCTRYFIHCLCITNLISLIDISSSSKQHLHYIEVSMETCCPQRTLSLKWKHSHIICMYNKHYITSLTESLVAIFTSAPAANKLCTTSWWPFRLAQYNGVALI